MSDKKVALIGAGAVGSYVIMGLYDKPGVDLMVIAERDRAKRLSNDGLIINSKQYHPRVVSPSEAGAEEPDYLVVALKYGALVSSLEDIAAAVSGKTAVVSLMNGVDSEEIISKKVGREHVLHAFIKISSTKIGNKISFPLPDERTGIFVGEVYSVDSLGQVRAEAFRSLFDKTPVMCHVREDILCGIWEKFAINMSRNLPQAVLGVGVGAYTDSSYVADIGTKLRSEVKMLAAAKGINISDDYLTAPSTKNQRYSTLQDLDAGRETEIEMFSGAVIRMAAELGLKCPYNEIIYDLIKALEEKNAGKFNY